MGLLDLLPLLMNWLGRYARGVDHLAVKNVALGAPLGGGSNLRLLIIRTLLFALNDSFLLYL